MIGFERRRGLVGRRWRAAPRTRAFCALAARRCCHSAWASAPFAPSARQSAQDVVGHHERLGSPSPGRRAPRRPRPRRAAKPCTAEVPCLLGAPLPMIVVQATSDGRGSASGFVERAADVVRVVAVAARRCASRSRGSARGCLRWTRGRSAPSMVILLSSHSTIRRPSPRWPARPIASWLMPSIRQPSPAIDPGVVIDQFVAEAGIEVPLGDRHADRHRQALPQRAGGRLDAVEQEILRVPGAGAAELAEVADVVHRRPRVAGQVQQRVDQHRAVAGRQHEAVAVGPVRIGRIELQDIRDHSTVATSAMPIGMLVQVALGHGHADRRGDALAQRPGGGLDARGVAVFRVAGDGGAPLPEVPSRRSSRPDSRPDRAGNRSASTRGRPTARSGRGRAIPAASYFRTLVNSTVATSSRSPSARPGDRIWRGGRRPWRARG